MGILKKTPLVNLEGFLKCPKARIPAMTIEVFTLIILGIFAVLPIVLILLLVNEISKQKKTIRTRRTHKGHAQPLQRSRIDLSSFMQGIVLIFLLGRILSYYGLQGSFAYAVAFISTPFIVSLFNQSNQKQTSSQSNLASLQTYLIQLLHGDREAAIRLVKYEKRMPGKTEEWYWKAAIERLIRDRQ